MPDWLHRTTKDMFFSVPPDRLPEPAVNYIESPDLSAVSGWSSIYWTITGDVVTLMSQAERDVVDAAALDAAREASVVRYIDSVEDVMRAFMLVVLDEINLHAQRVTDILNAVDNANDLAGLKAEVALIPDVPTRTEAQLRAAIRGKLGS